MLRLRRRTVPKINELSSAPRHLFGNMCSRLGRTGKKNELPSTGWCSFVKMWRPPCHTIPKNNGEYENSWLQHRKSDCAIRQWLQFSKCKFLQVSRKAHWPVVKYNPHLPVSDRCWLVLDNGRLVFSCIKKPPGLQKCRNTMLRDRHR